MSNTNKKFNFLHLQNLKSTTYCLSDLVVGENAVVINILDTDNKYYRQRLLAQGVVPGAIVKMETMAPLGDPIKISLLSSDRCLILRKKEAEIITIKKL